MKKAVNSVVKVSMHFASFPISLEGCKFLCLWTLIGDPNASLHSSSWLIQPLPLAQVLSAPSWSIVVCYDFYHCRRTQEVFFTDN